MWSMRKPPAVTERSIAVLPFENRSEARENGDLALGIQDEILTLLTRIGSLRVDPAHVDGKVREAVRGRHGHRA